MIESLCYRGAFRAIRWADFLFTLKLQEVAAMRLLADGSIYIYNVYIYIIYI